MGNAVTDIFMPIVFFMFYGWIPRNGITWSEELNVFKVLDKYCLLPLNSILSLCVTVSHVCFPVGSTTAEFGLPRWLSGKEYTCQCRRRGFDPRVGKILWRRKWQPTPVLPTWEIPWTEEPWGLTVPEVSKESDTNEQLNNNHDCAQIIIVKNNAADFIGGKSTVIIFHVSNSSCRELSRCVRVAELATASVLVPRKKEKAGTFLHEFTPKHRGLELVLWTVFTYIELGQNEKFYFPAEKITPNC